MDYTKLVSLEGDELLFAVARPPGALLCVCFSAKGTPLAHQLYSYYHANLQLTQAFYPVQKAWH